MPIIKIFIFLIFMILNINVYANTQKELFLKELYIKTHLANHLSWVKSGMMLSSDHIPNQRLEPLDKIIDARYTPLYFQQFILKKLNKELTITHIQSLLKWYSTPLGKKIIKLENIANSPIRNASIDAYIKQRLSIQSPRVGRAVLMNQLMKVLKIKKYSLQLIMSAVHRNHQLLGLTQVPYRSLEQTIQQWSENKKEMLAKRMKGMLFYTYRSLSDKELMQYIQIAQEPVMQKFQATQMQALSDLI